MTRRTREVATIDIYEPAAPAEVPVVHIRCWYGVPDLWVYRDTCNRVRTVDRVRGLPQPLPEGELLGWPPVGPVLAAQGV